MRVEIRRAAAALFTAVVLAAVVTGPVPAAAQCAMMGGHGGHDHAAMQAGGQARPSASDRKVRRSIDRLLSDERGRALLADALLEDHAFVEGLVQRLFTIPEWRAAASRELGAPDVKGARPGPAPGTPAVVFACPMHPDVTSSGPGDCPRCGMALVRKGTP